MGKVFLTIFVLSVVFVGWMYVPTSDKAELKHLVGKVWWRIALAVAVTLALLFLALNFNFIHF